MTVRTLSERRRGTCTRAKANQAPGIQTLRSESVLSVSWDDEFGRLNLIVLALGLLAVAGHYAPPWFGLA